MKIINMFRVGIPPPEKLYNRNGDFPKIEKWIKIKMGK